MARAHTRTDCWGGSSQPNRVRPRPHAHKLLLFAALHASFLLYRHQTVFLGHCFIVLLSAPLVSRTRLCDQAAEVGAMTTIVAPGSLILSSPSTLERRKAADEYRDTPRDISQMACCGSERDRPSRRAASWTNFREVDHLWRTRPLMLFNSQSVL